MNNNYIYMNYDPQKHPCRNCTKDMVVFDPFVGSGTTAVACREREREWIGFEISQNYCDIANERLSKQIVQNNLFNDL